jgi:ATP-binding cassette, subfamily B, bacterial PglK
MILNKILFLFSKNQKIDFIIIIILGIFFSILELFSIAIFLPLINLIQSGSVEFMSESIIFKTIFFDYLSISDYKHVTISISIIIILIYLIKLTYHRFFNRFRLKFVNNFTENLINNFFTKFQTQSYINYKYSSSSSVIHKIFTESNQIRNILDSVILAFTESFTITLLLITSLMYDYVITLIALLFFSTVYIVWQFFSKTDLNSLGRIRKSQEKQRFKIFQISYSSFREVLIYNQHKFFRKIFENHNYKATNTLYKYAFKRDNVKPLIEFITISSISFLIIALFFIEDYDSIMIRLAFFATISYKLMPSINKFSGLFQTIKFNKVSLDFNLESFHIEKIKSNKKDKIKVINEINVNNISYKYPGRDNFIFKNVNIIIKKGDIIGIKGESGSGKSTFIDLILGLLQPSSGDIYINNSDIQQQKNNYWSKVSTVSQQINLIHGTLKENLTFGDLSINDQDIYDIIKKVNLSQMLSNFTNGLDEVIYENSSNISGGQKQRIAIARALLRKPQLLILDEATSSLDESNEIQFINVIKEIKLKNPSLTVLIVSHTKAILEIADFVYNIEKSNFKLT